MTDEELLDYIGRVANALEDISRGIGSLRDGQSELIALSQAREKGFDKVADAYEKWGDAADRIEAKKACAEPAGVPILLIVEVLISLIRILLAQWPASRHAWDLKAMLRKLEPYQPVRPAEEEAEQ